MKTILIMGLSGSGKSTLSAELVELMCLNSKTVVWLNADAIRSEHNDWDFSEQGRLRQGMRMSELSESHSDLDFVICDFIAPLEQQRQQLNADYVVWMTTIEHSAYLDTDAVFEIPEKYSIRILDKNAEMWARIIYDDIQQCGY